ncbi:MAG: hypothetical protein AVDCRST_MAG66-2058, partial [uncultured Pseudonocardia sp.]
CPSPPRRAATPWCGRSGRSPTSHPTGPNAHPSSWARGCCAGSPTPRPCGRSPHACATAARCT